MFAYKKKTVASFSYRNFSRMAGFASPNFLKLVINGKRNLTNNSIAKIARGFKLKKPEREYFENLVYMNQAPGDMKLLQKAQYDYFSKWYLPVLRELVVFDEQNATAKKLAEKLCPAVRIKDVEAALVQLQSLGLIFQNEKGYWCQSEQVLTTGPEVKSLLVANFHHEMIKMAAASIDRFAPDERDITAVTMSIAKKDIPEIKNRITEFRKNILDEFAGTENPDQVIQVNFQLFPLAKTDKKGESK